LEFVPFFLIVALWSNRKGTTLSFTAKTVREAIAPPQYGTGVHAHISSNSIWPELVSMPTSAVHLTKTANKNRAPACVCPSTAAGPTDISVGCAISLSARYLLHLHVYDMCLFRSC
jgi:hypothetical protein